MDTLRDMVATLLLTAVCALLFRFLLPEGSVSRTAKTVVSLVTLCAVCVPLFNVWGKLRGRDGISSGVFSFSEVMTTFPYELAQRRAELAVEGACDDIISQYTDVPREIKVEAHIHADGSIEIERIRIVFEAEPERREAMTSELIENCGIAPEIRVKNADE